MKNPGALETAVNRHQPDTIEEFADNFRRAGPAIARDARLMEMKAGHVLNADQVGERGAEALRGHVYRGIRIRTEDGRVVVETECRNGRTNTRAHAPDRAATGMNRDGTAAHIATAYGMRRSLLMKAVADAVRAPRPNGGSAAGRCRSRGVPEVPRGHRQRTWRGAPDGRRADEPDRAPRTAAAVSEDHERRIEEQRVLLTG